MTTGVELAGVGVELIPGIAGGDNITIGTSTITGGTNGRVLYDNSGIIGEKTTTGTGSVVLATAPTLSLPVANAITLTPSNISALPGTPTLGMLASVNDGDSALDWGDEAVNSGAGATGYLVWWNGTIWAVFGK